MFEIQLSKCSSPKNKLGGKVLTDTLPFNVDIKEDSSISDPVILINTDAAIYSYNYMYIPLFGRYYYIKDKVSVNNNLWEIYAHVDVLQTYADDILLNSGVIKRQEYAYNLYLDDPEFKSYNKERIQTLKFPQGFSKALKYILAVNGSN